MAARRSSVVALAAVLAVSGCQIGGARDGGGSSRGGGEQERVPVASGPVPAAAQDKDLGSRETADSGNKIKVTVTSLAREGNLAVLNFTATVVSQADVTSSWQVSDFFGDSSGPGSDSLSANGVYLTDGKYKKKYIVASDSYKTCLCSRNLSATFVRQGQTVVLSATFAAPPPDVRVVDVHIPNSGVFRNVPVS